MKEIYVARGFPEAHLVRLFLAAHGIEAVVQGEQSAALAPLVSRSPAVHLVHEADLERARLLVAEYDRKAAKGTGDGVEWKCASCGETLSESFNNCWNCGAPRTAAALAAEEEEEELPGVESPLAGAAMAEGASLRGQPASRRGGHGLWIGVAIAVCVAAIPEFIFCVSWLPWPNPVRQQPRLDFIVGMSVLTNPWLIVVLLALMDRSGEPWSGFGFRRTRWWLVPLVGTILMLLVRQGLLLLNPLVAARWPPAAIGDYPHYARPEGVAEHVVVVVGSCVTGFAEELFVRSYLIRKLEQISGSTALGLLASAAWFGAVHLYLGTNAALTGALFSLMMGAAYCVLRNIWFVAFAHALFNVVAFVV